MSGPTTAVFAADPVTALLSAAAIRAAEAIAEGYARAAELHEENAAARQARRTEQSGAARQEMGALEREAGAAEARLDHLLELAEQLDAPQRGGAARPLRPAAGDPPALAAYVRGLNLLADEMQSILLAEAARQQAEFAGQPAGIALPPLRDEAARQRQVQAATATIVEQSLKDLGYQVEALADTLFVEGGVVHFRRPGWGEHMVRLRVDTRASTLNFNVLRAVDAGSNERSVLDHLAEDRWCAEFPALLQTLAARGVRLEVTRRLAAGELPVQLVVRDKLPEFADDEAVSSAGQALARRIE